MTINNNRFVGAVDAPSPNHGGLIVPRFIVMHYTAGWTADSAVNTFKSAASKVSAQITIDTDGTIYQHVDFNVRAWHAGPSSFGGYSGMNDHSVGIEFVNPGFLKKLDDGSFKDSRGGIYSAKKVGRVVESVYPKAGSGTFYWPVYTEAQLDAGERVTADLIASYKIIDIVSHEEIDTRGWKTDPGPAFPMNRFRALLRDRQNDVVEYAVTAPSLNLRGGPGTNFAVLGKLVKGADVIAFETRGEWIRITDAAWVHSGFLRRTT